MMYGLRRFAVIALLALLGPFGAWAASSLSDVKVTNAQREATVSVSFTGPPEYTFATLHGPDRVVLDVTQTGKVGGLPLNFSGQNLVKRIRSSQPKNAQTVRLVFDLTQRAKTRVATRQEGNSYIVVFTITSEAKTTTNTVRKAPVPVPVPVVSEPVRKAPVTSSSANPFTPKSAAVSGTATSITPVAAGCPPVLAIG